MGRVDPVHRTRTRWGAQTLGHPGPSAVALTKGRAGGPNRRGSSDMRKRRAGPGGVWSSERSWGLDAYRIGGAREGRSAQPRSGPAVRRGAARGVCRGAGPCAACGCEDSSTQEWNLLVVKVPSCLEAG